MWLKRESVSQVEEKRTKKIGETAGGTRKLKTAFVFDFRRRKKEGKRGKNRR